MCEQDEHYPPPQNNEETKKQKQTLDILIGINR